MDTESSYVVDPHSAEQLARSFVEFTPVQIRETLEGHPVPQAMRLLSRFGKDEEPYRKLKDWALINETGFYRPTAERPSANEEYERYLYYLSVKEAVHRQKKGTGLTLSQREDLTRKFYAPAYRAQMFRLSDEAWREYHRSLREDTGEEVA